MDRDSIIEQYLRAVSPGAYMRCLRICGTGVWSAAVVHRGDVVAVGRGTSLAAALDALAEALTASRAA